MSTPLRIRRSLRLKLFIAFLLIIAVGVLTLLVAALALGPSLFDQVLVGMMGPGAERMADLADPQMTRMAQAIIQAFWVSATRALLISACMATVTAVAVSLFISKRIVIPLQSLLAASRRIAAGRYSERVSDNQDDELGALAVQFNIMATELEAAERRRVALIGDVAHELRTPLSTIEGYLEGLLDDMVKPNAETWAVLHDEVGRLRRLVQDLQELSRAEAHQLSLHPTSIAPMELIAQAQARIAPQYADKDIGLTTDVAPTLPAVKADRDRALQVLINLLGNALHYTPKGGAVSITAHLANDWGDGQESGVVFCVTDNGVGIAPEHLPHVFERFFRVDKARSRTLGGSGIGLTIAKTLIEAQGGRIWAESDGLSRGATFSFTVPPATSAFSPLSASLISNGSNPIHS